MSDVSDRLDRMNRDLDRQQSLLSKLFDSTKRNTATLAKSVSSVDKNVKDFADKTEKVVDTLSKFKNSVNKIDGFVGILAVTLASASEVIAESVDAYRRVTEVGQDFSGSLLELQKSAASAALPLDEFVSLIEKNNLVVATTGVKAFTDLGKTARSSLRQFGMLGMTTNQFNEYLSEYAETSRLFGNSQALTSSKAAESLEALIKETDAYSKLTGKQRQSILQDSQRAMRSASLQVMMAKMTSTSSAEMQKAIQGTVTYLAALPGEAGQTLSTLLAETIGFGTSALSDGIDDFNRVGLGAVGGMMDDLARKVKAGTATEADKEAFRKGMYDVLHNNLESLNVQLLGPNKEIAKRMIQMHNELQNINDKDSGPVDPKKQETAFFLDLEDSMKRISGFLRTKFFSAFEKVYNSIKAGIDSGAYDKFFDFLSNAFNSGADKLGEMLSPENLIAFGTAIGKAITSIGEFTGNLIDGYKKLDAMFFTPLGKWWDTNNIFDPLKEKLGSFTAGVVVILGGLLAVKLAFGGIIGMVARVVGALGNFAYQLGKSSITGTNDGRGISGYVGGEIGTGINKVAGGAARAVGKVGVVGAGLMLAGSAGLMPEGFAGMASVAGSTMLGTQIGSLLGPIGAVVGGIVGAVYGVVTNWEQLVKDWGTLSAKASTLWADLKTSYVDPFMKFLSDWYSDTTLSKVITGVVNWLSSLKDMLFGGIIALWNKIVEYKHLASNLATASFDRIVEMAKSGVQTAKAALTPTTQPKQQTVGTNNVSTPAQQNVPSVNVGVLQQQVQDLQMKNKALEESQNRTKLQLDRLIEVIAKGNAETAAYLRNIADTSGSQHRLTKQSVNSY